LLFELKVYFLCCQCSQDTEVIVWDIVGERGLHRLSGHKGAVTQALFMAGHDVLISSAKDSFVKFWDLETAHCFKTLTAHKAEVGKIQGLILGLLNFHCLLGLGHSSCAR
jgi:WD40 repeat protein